MLHKTPPAGFRQRKMNYGPYSPSRLIAAHCPQRFFSQYVRKDRVVGHTQASARGSAIHEVLAKITYAKQANAMLTTKQVSEWVSEAIGMFPAAYPQIDLVKESADAYVANPSPYINQTTTCESAFAIQLWEEESFFDDSAPNQIFVPVPYILEDGSHNPNCFFGGKLDQITIDEEVKTITILDHKSTPSANENEDHTFQVGAYAWLVSLFYPGYTMKTVIHYAHPRLNCYAPPVIWTEEDLREIEGHILARVDALERMENFEAIPGSQCDYCHVTQECGVYQKVREQKSKGTIDLNVRSFEDLVRLAKELRVVDSMYSELNKALKQGIETLCPENGVNIGGMWYGFKASEEGIDWTATDQEIRQESGRAQARLEEGVVDQEERSRLEKIAGYKTLDGFFNAHGVNPNNFKAFNGTKLKAVWRLDKPGMIEELSPFIVKDKKTKFGGYKN